MNQSIAIREVTAEDAPTAATLFSEFNALVGADGLPDSEAFLSENTDVVPASMARRLEAISEVEKAWLAEVDGKPAGLICLRLVPYIGQEVPFAEVTQLFVREAFKRQGVGASLVAFAEHVAIRAGATCVHIITSDDNLDAQAFYRAQGYTMPGVEFVKHLSPRAADVN